MRYSGIQPQYFPRLHYFARILNTDIFVVRDEVQFVRKHKYPDGTNGKSYQAHTPIKQSFGVHFLQVPILHEGHKPINTTKIQYHDHWIEQHLKTLQICYSKTSYFSVIYPQIEKLLTKKYENLAQLNMATILWGLRQLLDISSLEEINDMLEKQKTVRLKKILLASESKSLNENTTLKTNEKIISLLKEIGADEDYCGGTAFTAYMDKELFEKNGIKITLQEWECKEYPQLFLKQQPFIPNLSIIDLLMNVSVRDALTILKSK